MEMAGLKEMKAQILRQVDMKTLKGKGSQKKQTVDNQKVFHHSGQHLKSRGAELLTH
jgi:hypothetical protein